MINNIVLASCAMATRKKTIIAVVISFTLVSCSANSNIAQQLTSYNVGCATKDVVVLDESHSLNDEVTWTAKCDGKTYHCTYHDTAGTACHEILE
jgi:hypothetical protein